MMKFFGKTLGLLLVSLTLASCGGGGGNGGALSPPQSGTITLTATTTTLPVNVWGYTPTQYGNPTQAEVTIVWRNADGTYVTGHDIAVSIAPTNVAALSCLVDGTDCTDGNALFGSVPIKGINGQATIFVNATQTAGTANFVVSAVDPATSRTVTASLVFTVTSGVGPLPANITLTPQPAGVYLPSSGGINTSAINATVTDGSGQLVPDPVSGNNGVDNIQFEIVGNAGGAVLSSNSVGGSTPGTVVTSHTVHGAAVASLQVSDSTPQGVLQVRATVDRADNNVSNGIQDPVSSTTSVVVSDGKLYSLVLTSPTENAITVNPVSSNVSAPTDSTGTVTVPPTPDGTYSLTVSALATDRQGNPVPTGTSIQFGVVDAPLAGFPDQGAGAFLISGNDGDPKESGTLFTAPTGQFATAGGGAGPGDTLLVFGDAVTGNSDLESARQIQSVSGNTSLTVTYPFNPNDTTGTSVNSGPVLPYVIGRAQEGNIGASASTDAHGVAMTTLNYPVSRIGKGALIWARGASDTVNGTPRLVSTISGGGFPGVAPGQLVVSQTPLPGNVSLEVSVCLYDALGAPIQGSGIGFAFSNLGVGSGSIDGQTTAGAFASPTGSDGCTTGEMQTSGIAGSSGGAASAPTVTFSAGPSTPAVPVPITASGALVLQAAPSALGGSGGSVTLKLTDANGNPVGSAAVSVTCSAGAGSGLIAPTNASGQTTAAITASLTGYKPANTTATCTFTAGGATATVNLQGADLCTADPNNAACGGGGSNPPTNDTLSVVVVRGSSTTAATVTSTPTGINCGLGATQQTNLCTASFPDQSTVLINATGGTNYTFAGACTALTASSATVVMTAGASCQVTVN